MNINLLKSLLLIILATFALSVQSQSRSKTEFKESLHAKNESAISSNNKNAQQSLLSKKVNTDRTDLLKPISRDVIKVLVASPNANDFAQIAQPIMQQIGGETIEYVVTTDLNALTISEMLTYNVLWTFNFSQWSHGTATTPEDWSNKLGDFIDAGGYLIESQFVNGYDSWGLLSGNYITGNKSPFIKSTKDVEGGNNAALGAVNLPNHPIMSGINSVSTNYFVQDCKVRNNATLICNWNLPSADPLVAIYDNIVAFNADPIGSVDNVAMVTFLEDGYKMFYNAIVWLRNNQAPTGAPGAVTNYVVTAGANGTNSAQLSWTNPTITAQGEPLLSILKLEVFIDDAETAAYTIENPAIGANLTWEATALTTGKHKFTIVCTNSAGKGRAKSSIIWIGPDVPAPVANLMLIVEGKNGRLTWTAPTTGLHDGYFVNENVKYRIKRLPDQVIVAESETDTTFLDSNIQQFNAYKYEIVAFNDNGDGGIATSNEAILGGSVQLPYTMGFEPNEITAVWRVIDNNNDGKTWALRSTDGNTMPTCAVYNYHSFKPADDWLISPNFSFEKNKLYMLTFYSKSHSPNFNEEMKVMLGQGVTVESFTTELLSIVINFTGYTKYTIFISVPDSGIYNIAFQAVSKANMWRLYLDDISVTEVPNTAIISVNPSALTQTVYEGQIVNSTFKISNLGGVTLNYSNEVVYADENTPFLVVNPTSGNISGASFNDISVTYNALSLTQGTYNATIKITSNDETNPNIVIPVELIVTPPLICMPPTNLTSEILNNDSIKITWTDAESKSVLLEEGFENGIPDSWKQIDADGDGRLWVTQTNELNEPFVPHTGEGVVGSLSTAKEGSMWLALTPNNWLISPDVSGATLLTFWVTTQSDIQYAHDHYGVYASSTGTDITDFTLIMEENTTAYANTNWTKKIVELPLGTKYVAWRHYKCVAQYAVLIDDVEISGGAINKFNIYRNSKLIAEYVSDTTYIDPDLPYGQHCYTVKKVCEIGFISEVSAATCANIEHCSTPSNLKAQIINENDVVLAWDDKKREVILSESFENGIPSTWKQIDADGDGRLWITQTTELEAPLIGHTGTGLIASLSVFIQNNTWIPLTPDNWIISPDITGASQISYWVVSFGNTIYSHEHYGVYASSSGFDINDFNLVMEESTAAYSLGKWTKKVLDLPPGTKYIAFRHFNCTDQYAMGIDDIEITAGNPIPTIKFNVYRNEQLIADNVFNTSYTDANVPNGHYCYKVKKVCAPNVLSEFSTDFCVDIELSECPTPINLKAEAIGEEGHKIKLSWELPTEEGKWISWSGQAANNSIGGPIDFSVAHRFEPSDLTEHAGKKLKMIKFIPRQASYKYSLRVWTGGSLNNPHDLILDQEVISPTINEWNEINLAAPITIDANKELWFGYRCEGIGGTPAGVDIGPAINGKGNIIITPTTCSTLLNINPEYNYNWTIAGFVINSKGKYIELTTANNNSLSKNENNTALNIETRTIKPNLLNNDSKTIIGYDIYKNGVLMFAKHTSTTYIYTEQNAGQTSYFVKTICSDGESDQSNTCNINIAVNEIESQIAIYPNPTNDYLNILTPKIINHFDIYNYVGQLIETIAVTNNNKYEIDVSKYNAGIYTIKFVYCSGKTISKQFVVNK